MRNFLRIFIVFIYFLLTLFIGSSSVFACENIEQNNPIRYFVLSSKTETVLLNNKKEEECVISQNKNELQITKSSNRKNNYGFGSFDKLNTGCKVLNNYINENPVYPVCISYNISPNLKNAIYTRAP